MKKSDSESICLLRELDDAYHGQIPLYLGRTINTPVNVLWTYYVETQLSLSDLEASFLPYWVNTPTDQPGNLACVCLPHGHQSQWVIIAYISNTPCYGFVFGCGALGWSSLLPEKTQLVRGKVNYNQDVQERGCKSWLSAEGCANWIHHTRLHKLGSYAHWSFPKMDALIRQTVGNRRSHKGADNARPGQPLRDLRQRDFLHVCLLCRRLGNRIPDL